MQGSRHGTRSRVVQRNLKHRAWDEWEGGPLMVEEIPIDILLLFGDPICSLQM